MPTWSHSAHYRPQNDQEMRPNGKAILQLDNKIIGLVYRATRYQAVIRPLVDVQSCKLHAQYVQFSTNYRRSTATSMLRVVLRHANTAELCNAKKRAQSIPEYFLLIKVIVDPLIPIGDHVSPQDYVDMILEGILEDYDAFY
ncbi:hypothetical protein CR513_18480, partial [Mucuna pruriens]